MNDTIRYKVFILAERHCHLAIPYYEAITGKKVWKCRHFVPTSTKFAK